MTDGERSEEFHSKSLLHRRGWVKKNKKKQQRTHKHTHTKKEISVGILEDPVCLYFTPRISLWTAMVSPAHECAPSTLLHFDSSKLS